MAYQAKKYQKFIATAATATLVAQAVAPLASAAVVTDFTDVAPQYQEAVQFLLDTGATKGKTETQFGVYDNITRQDAAVQLATVLGLEVDTTITKTKFTDVPARTAPYVQALVDAGITSGKTETTFGANEEITRGQLAIWIATGFGLEGSGEVDFIDVASEYKEAVSALVENKVTSGKTETQFGTNEKATRGQFAIFLYRAANVEVVEEVAIESVSAINLTKVEVQFNQVVEEFSESNLVVTDEDSEKQDIKSVTLAKDGKSATVEFYDELVDETTYTFTATIGEVVSTAALDFVVGEPTTIKLAAQTVAPGKAVAYKILDENGLDITSEYTVDVDSDDDSFFTIAEGSVKVKENATGSIFAQFSVTDSEGNVIKSATVKVTVVEAGEVVGYEVEGFKNELFYVDKDTTTADDTEFELAVKGVDENGVATKVVSFATTQTANKFSATVTYTAANGKETTKALESAKVESADFRDAVGDITLNVYVGSLQVFEDTFKVTDNRVAPEFTITSNDLEIDNIADIVMFNTLFEEIVVLPTGVTIEDVDFVSNNNAVITDNDSNEEGTVASTQNGETIIYVDTITVVDNKVTDTEEDDETYVLTLDETFNVSVNITDNYDEFEVVENAQNAQNAVTEGGVAIFGSDIVVEKEELVGSGYGKTGIAQTNLGVIDGNGKTLSVEGANNSTWDSAIYTKGGTIKNVTINSGFRGIFIDASKGDVVVDNVTIDGTTYAISSDNGGNNKLIVTNSTLNGWTSFARTHSEVSFTNCNFGKSNGYAYLRPYSSTTLTDCDFSAGFELDSRHATITLKNCKVGGTLVTTENVIELLGATAGNVTIEN